MNLQDNLYSLLKIYDRIKSLSDLNEDDTKTVFVVPFLNYLGFKDLLIKSTYHVDPHSRESPTSIDYAVKLNEGGPPVVLVECEEICKKNLEDFHADCKDYFQLAQGNHNIDFLLLTNGYEYRFYTDLDRNNVLDKTPILSFTLESFNCDDIKLLGLFRKNQFDSAKIKSYVKDVSDRKKIKAFIQSDVIGLKPSFINFVTKEVFETNKSGKRDFVKENMPTLKLGAIVPTNENVDGNILQYDKETESIPENLPGEQWIEVSNNSTEIFHLRKREKLYGYRYNNEKVIEKLYWSDMYVEVIKDLFSQEKDPNERETLGKTLDIIPFATTKRKGNYKKLFDDYKLNTNNNTTIKIEKLIRALEHHENKNSLFVKIKNS